MLEVKSENINYLAKVVRMPQLRAHPNADRLLLTTVDNQVVITGKDSKENDLYVFFPLETQIASEFVSFTSNFSDVTLNRDSIKKGLFSPSCRVKTQKLRGVVSEGYLHPVSDVNDWLKSKKVKFQIGEEHVGKEFDTINDIVFVNKYVNKQEIIRSQQAERTKNRANKKLKRESKIVAGQYRVTLDTEQLKRNIHKIAPDDYITVSYKMHGCAFSAGRVLCKKPLKWYEKMLKFLGVNIVDSQYDLVYASRRIVKNEYADKKSEHYYDLDVWGLIADKYKVTLKDGVTIGGEICGQLPDGGWIQKDYDYGLPPNTCDLFVYRAYYTNPSGEVFEFTTPQLIKYCEKMGLKTVPIYFYGKAKDLYPNLSLIDHWQESFLEKLKQDYLEKNCYICRNKVPSEGICISKNDDLFEPYKLKSLAFLERETKELDKGEENIEDAA